MGTGGQENKGPSVAELQRYVREKVTLEFLLTNGERLVGTLRWFDEQAFSVATQESQPTTVLRVAVLAYRPVT